MVRQLLGVAPTSLTYTVNTPIINVTMETMVFGARGPVTAFPTGAELTPPIRSPYASTQQYHPS